MPGLTYENSGVNYDALDAFKRACQRLAATTAGALGLHGFTEMEGTRGESAYLIETPDSFLAHVEEGLGTKNLVADAMQKLTGQSFWKNIGIDTVATIVNDLITVGGLPLTVAMHAAVGDSNWFSDTQRAEDLAAGFAEGCRKSGAVWGGGETPALSGIVEPASIVLAGSALGIVRPKSNRIAGDLADGDAIVLLASSGVQTNGLSLCRKLAEQLPQGYLTPLEDGRSYGAALLAPSVIYVPFVAACQQKGVPLKYAAHITGHGWRKLMRARAPFVYRMTDVRATPAIFSFIQKHAGMDDRQAYALFNMGAGFAAFVAPDSVADCLDAARGCGLDAWVGGIVTRQGDRKAVEIVPAGIVFEADSLQVR